MSPPYLSELPPPRESLSPRSQSEEMRLPTPPPKAGPTKRKRGRITKEQLALLERLFAADCSPSVAQRREIALQVGCPDRQIQVWYQNRRAKAKNNGERCRTSRPRVSSSTKQPPELCAAIQTDFAMLILEDDPSVFTIPCTTLTIGGWSRVNYKGQRDLLAWVCEQKRCLTWFIRSHEYSFKMQVPFDIVNEAIFRNTEPGNALLILELSQPPSFFLRRNLAREEGMSSPGWRLCDDWTEDKAATHTLRHVLGGPALPLASVVGNIRNQRQGAKPTIPHPVAYPNPIENHLSPHSNPTSTTPANPSPILEDPLYPRGPCGWNSTTPFTESHTPLYDAKLPPNMYQGSDQSHSEALYGLEPYKDIHVEPDEMGPPGVDVGVTGMPPRHLSPLHAPQPRSHYAENKLNDVAHFHSPSYCPPPFISNGQQHQQQQHHHRSPHPLPHFSELFPVSDESQ